MHRSLHAAHTPSPSTALPSATITPGSRIRTGRKYYATGALTASKIVDSDPNSYWQSSGAAFPQWAQVDLGKLESMKDANPK